MTSKFEKVDEDKVHQILVKYLPGEVDKVIETPLIPRGLVYYLWYNQSVEQSHIDLSKAQKKLGYGILVFGQLHPIHPTQTRVTVYIKEPETFLTK